MLSEYGTKLLAKQKLKAYYGNIPENQFLKLYQIASKKKGKTVNNLLSSLESRLDSVVYRMNFALTIFQSKQIINHGHILVNGKTVNISNFKLKNGDLIQVSENYVPNVSKSITQLLEKGHFMESLPPYLEVNYTIMAGIFLYTPDVEEIPYHVDMNPKLIVEFYSGK